jgi:bilirubin oxidase
MGTDMNSRFFCSAVLAVAFSCAGSRAFDPLVIPPAITGTVFNLTLVQTSKQYRAGAQTVTYAFQAVANGTNVAMNFWGPTLIMNRGDFVTINVSNALADMTTVHWHGFHIPAIMDGGPHQMIDAGMLWSPMFTITNDAATYWYHPHMHGSTQEQLTKGAGGFIIVRDPAEAALALPRTYGVDDIPVMMTSRRFLYGANNTNAATTNQFAFNHTVDNYGDYEMANGVTNAQVVLPRQIVRLRLLNAEVERGYNIGFSDNRTFHVIGNDQGLLSAPVAVTRVKMMVGERVEILLNLTGDAIGTNVDLKAWNGEINGLGPPTPGPEFGFPGVESNPTQPTGNEPAQPNGSLLNHTNFNIVHIVVTNATTNAILAIPATLATNTYWTTNDATVTRTINLTGGNAGAEFTFNNVSFTMTNINHRTSLNAVEKWILNNNSGAVFGHAIHIHDVKFNIVARSPVSSAGQVTTNGLAAPYESGWKDTVYVPKTESVTVLAKFDTYASGQNPFMFHCHFLNHEDGGMMGQFLVTNSATENLSVSGVARTGTNNIVKIPFVATVGTTYLLQYSTDPNAGTWTDIGSITSDGSAATFVETDTNRLTLPRGFYRVKMPVITQ